MDFAQKVHAHCYKGVLKIITKNINNKKAHTVASGDQVYFGALVWLSFDQLGTLKNAFLKP